jgi:hypothetical protein
LGGGQGARGLASEGWAPLSEQCTGVGAPATRERSTPATLWSEGSKPHAVFTTTGGFAATYDANGNMTVRVEVSGSQRITYTQEWDAVNRLAKGAVPKSETLRG